MKIHEYAKILFNTSYFRFVEYHNDQFFMLVNKKRYNYHNKKKSIGRFKQYNRKSNRKQKVFTCS
jgi:hypothetical protein